MLVDIHGKITGFALEIMYANGYSHADMIRRTNELEMEYARQMVARQNHEAANNADEVVRLVMEAA